MGCDLCEHKSCCPCFLYFNPRTHVGCDAKPQRKFLEILKFQSTHPRGVRQRCEITAGDTGEFQSTHPRGVRPTGSIGMIILILISIHAPTWGATHDRTGARDVGQNFNPRTHVGCDFLGIFRTRGPRYFNPRTHVGCDLRRPLPRPKRSSDFNPRTHVGCDESRLSLCRSPLISIHAPTWGATPCESLVESEAIFQSTHPRGVRLQNSPENADALKFQSTHPRGVRPDKVEEAVLSAIFQSTHPRGVRRVRGGGRGFAFDFNPRTHVGCDLSAP